MRSGIADKYLGDIKFMLYIMRHGKTDWNAQKKLQGRSDIPLNEEGRHMAKEAAVKYADVHLDVCFASPLIRAKETAELFLEGRNIPIITDDRLMEMCFGEFEGVENSFSDPDCPVNVIFKSPENYKGLSDCETFEELFKRTGEFLTEVVEPELKKGKDVLIVGHGAMNCSIICQIKKLPIKEFWSAGIENCKLMKLL